MTDAATRARDAEELARWLGDINERGEQRAVLVRSLAADAARLDWLEARTRDTDGIDVEHQDAVDYPGCTPRPAGYSITRTHYDRDGAGVEWFADRLPTLRDAIDAAMAAANARALADAFPVPDVTPDAGVGE